MKHRSTVIAAALLTRLASADIVQLGAAKDTTIQSNSGAMSNGAGPVMSVGRTASNGSRRALLQFDVAAAIPAGSTVNSATLTLYMAQTSHGSTEIELRRVAADWGEGTSWSNTGNGATASPGDATWSHQFYDTVLWAASGGDFAADSSGAATVGGVGFYTWDANSSGIADVQAWLDQPAANFGWLLKDAETAASAKLFHSHESGTPSMRPMLTIDYTVPEPASAALLIVAAWAGKRATREARRQPRPLRGHSPIAEPAARGDR